MKAHCTIVTCFSEDQPGFLDFSYRIHALAKHYHLTIISQDVLQQPELLIPAAEYMNLGRRPGKLGWLSYLWQCALHIRRQKTDLIMLLHSSAAPLSLLSKMAPVCLYWNEHPTNLIRLPEHFSPLKYCLAAVCQKLIFLGARCANIVMPIGEEHRDNLLAKGFDKQRLQMIYMGVADYFFGCAFLPGRYAYSLQQLRLIYIGSVNEQRGRDVMLQAIAEVITAGIDVHLTLVGADPKQVDFCTDEAIRLGISEAVTILGRLPGNEIPPLLSVADWGLCLWEDKPWWRFNPPTKLFEYLAAGLPVLASNIRTHSRYIQHEENGFIFDYGAKPLAMAIRSIAQKEAKEAYGLKLKRNALESGKQYLWSGIEPIFIDAVKQAQIL